MLPAGTPEGAAFLLLAIPIVNQHLLSAVVLYGAHSNHTLLDPDEVELLNALSKAAVTSHQQVRIALLQREVAALTSENSALTRETAAQQRAISQFETSLLALVQKRVVGGQEGPV